MAEDKKPTPESPLNKLEALARLLPATITFADFLQSTPPNVERSISNLFGKDYQGHWVVNSVEIDLHCDTPKCDGVRSWKPLATTSTPKRKHGLKRISHTYVKTA